MVHAESTRKPGSPTIQRAVRPRLTKQTGSSRGAKAQSVRPEKLPPPSAVHLLLAEDDGDLRRLLVETFEEEGFRVTEAADGRELRRWISLSGRSPQFARPDVLVSDIRLPGFTGLELLAELREKDWSLPVILITAYGDDRVHREGERLGAALVLDKPFDADELVSAVRRLVPAA